MAARATITINRGSDLNFDMVWSDRVNGVAVPKNLTGYTVDAFEAQTVHPNVLTLTVTDAAEGKISGRIPWAAARPAGAGMSFRVRLTQGGNRLTSPEIVVVIQ